MLSCGLLLASANAYRALGVVTSCRLLSRGLFLASANAYRALGVVTSCRLLSRGLFLASACRSDKGLVRPSSSLC